ncbi:S8 family peptidase [Stigmatella aurantiaca]|uniref:Extracellular protease n=1 Tax=Stigmatella aurantiaca (strain DW4/3-1) TaxID=378806 RepID=Q09E26_STIAD|nr:S8 family peptidase [Stigmatella aurantiaca]ADO74764.1 Peptidase, S8A (Subtilisin) subfamily [Stigmatella aurantiaca DW4/3-1]EAU70092.1 extracellular protease [Stigmatella aurantiaca DW4/3-1]
MRRLLILGLLLLTACKDTGTEDPDPGKPPAANKGRIQGQLSPFQGSSASVGGASQRPPALQGEQARKLTQAFSRAIAQKQQQRKTAAMGLTDSGLPILMPPAGAKALARLPQEESSLEGEMLVRFEEAGLDAQAALERVQRPGYRAVHKGYASEYLHVIAYEPLDGHVTTLAETGQLMAQVEKMAGVRFAEKNLRMHAFKTPNDKGYALQWHYPSLNLSAAWDVVTNESNPVVVAVVDTGIRPHPDLQGVLLPGYDMISDASNAGDRNGRDNDPTDEGGDEPGGGSSFHGTHVAGTIGAATNNQSGVAGVSWGAKIVPVRALGKLGGSSADIVAAMTWAAGGTVTGVPANPNPAKVVNLSLGGAAPPQKAYQDVIDAYPNTIFVVAAGNENVNATNTTPCNQQNVICVGSTNFAGKRSSFSNFGAPVDVMASGGEMREDLNGDGYADGVLSTSFDEEGNPAYVFNQGTSMASPHVAGVVALLARQSTGLMRVQAESLLKTTASTSSQCNEGCGAGLVNALAALKKLQGGSQNDPPKLGVTTSQLSFQGSGSQQLVISNLGGGTLQVAVSASGTQASAVSLSPASVSVPAYGSDVVTVTVNASGLSSGEYSATLSLTGSNGAGNASVSVKIRVGVREDKNAFIGFAWQDNLGDWQVDDDAVVEVLASRNYQYSIDLSPHEYYALATIDDDEDGQFFEDSDRTGFWRNVDSFEGIPLVAQQTVTSISFDLVPLAPIDDEQVVGAPCGSDSDCENGARCNRNYLGGYCTFDCDSRQPCPVGSKCFNGSCLATCTDPSEGQSTCRTDYVCYDDNTGLGLCLPDCREQANICLRSCDSRGYCQ